jgi:hypothetical protein
MHKEGTKNYFSNEALAKFAVAQGKTVEKVICHLWQNNINKNEVMELIDNLEIHFNDKHKLTISSNAEGDALDAINFNFRETAEALKKEFEGKIKLLPVNASTTKMWEDVTGKKLESVQIVKEGEYYLADSILLNFGVEKRTVSINPADGLIIDYFEEV